MEDAGEGPGTVSLHDTSSAHGISRSDLLARRSWQECAHWDLVCANRKL